jgi:ribonuclease HII
MDKDMPMVNNTKLQANNESTKKKEKKEKTENMNTEEKNEKKPKKERKPKIELQHFYNNETTQLEIGIDEAGRGPMFGRVYSAAVILPKNDEFQYHLLKDSKKFTSLKKIQEVANYIKENALAYSIEYEDEKIIDKINIRNATHSAMHKAVKNTLNIYNSINNIKHDAIQDDCEKYYLLVDGNDFKSYTYMNNSTNIIKQINHIVIEGGDNKFCSIAAASILAKVERDKYIKEICDCYKKLDIYYGLESNKGYGTAKHMDGIKNFGISPWHRTTYGCCKQAIVNSCDYYL